VRGHEVLHHPLEEDFGLRQQPRGLHHTRSDRHSSRAHPQTGARQTQGFQR
ncbi:hypothetical protein KI387_001926, partial [Taxus chinensis]